MHRTSRKRFGLMLAVIGAASVMCYASCCRMGLSPRQILLATLLALGLTTSGAEWVSEEAGVSFQLPTDAAWMQIKGPRAEARLVLQRTDTSAAVAFIAFDKKPGPRVLNDDFIKSWEKGYYRKGSAQKVSGEFFTFKGRRAYRAGDRATRDGVMHLGTIILWLEDDRLFEIAATKVGGEPLKDTVIKEFVDSMKVLSKSPK